MRMKMAMLLGLVTLGSIACGERTPTSVDPDLLALHPTTVEVRLSWEEFGSNLEVFGGYGSLNQLGTGFVAHAFGGALEARTLVRFADLPRVATVTDTTGTSRTDTLLTLRSGRVVVFLDTLNSVADGPVTLELGAVRQRWDAATATWAMAVDSTGEALAWAEPGGGPVIRVATAVWDPAAPGDSVVFALDSAKVEIWRDTSAVNQGALLGLVTAGARLKVNNVILRARVRPSVRPDTLVDLAGTREALTFLYTPEPGPPGSDVRVGGAPAWRTVLDITVPARLTGPASLCAAAGCPVELTPTRVNYAALVLSSRRTRSGFHPSDSLGLDVRAVHERSSMPKSPLGPSLVGAYGKRVGPGLFAAEEGTEVEIPITAFVRAILEGDSVGGFPPPRSLVLLSAFEPSSLTFASFFGPGTARAPVLKLIVTAGRSVQLP
ncbi:MAG: hypothetical protein Q8N53_05075 [Longimicrobiales bacterium]|nr:hypothetical protein [Longimicrobiales bacterium]